MIFTIHFGCFPPIFGSTPIYRYLVVWICILESVRGFLVPNATKKTSICPDRSDTCSTWRKSSWQWTYSMYKFICIKKTIKYHKNAYNIMYMFTDERLYRIYFFCHWWINDLDKLHRIFTSSWPIPLANKNSRCTLASVDEKGFLSGAIWA